MNKLREKIEVIIQEAAFNQGYIFNKGILIDQLLNLFEEQIDIFLSSELMQDQESILGSDFTNENKLRQEIRKWFEEKRK